MSHYSESYRSHRHRKAQSNSCWQQVVLQWKNLLLNKSSKESFWRHLHLGGQLLIFPKTFLQWFLYFFLVRALRTILSRFVIRRGTAVRRAVPDCSKIEMVSSDRKYVMTNLRILSTEFSEFNLATNRSSCEFNPERSFAMNFMKSFCGGFGRSESQFARESSSEPNPLYGAISLAGTEIQNQFSYR